jgi:hypothetical protein
LVPPPKRKRKQTLCVWFVLLLLLLLAARQELFFLSSQTFALLLFRPVLRHHAVPLCMQVRMTMMTLNVDSRDSTIGYSIVPNQRVTVPLLLCYV